VLSVPVGVARPKEVFRAANYTASSPSICAPSALGVSAALFFSFMTVSTKEQPVFSSK